MTRESLRTFLYARRAVLGALCCMFVTGFFATYHLTESPKTWFDEGLLTQISRNFFENGSYVLRAAPDAFVPSSLLTTSGFPVIIPVAMSFSLFGIGILQARVVMVVYLLVLTLAAYLFAYRAWGFRTAFISTLLIATHPPLYGNGKNVLGEVPGLAFFFLCAYFFRRLEAEKGSGLRAWIGTAFFAAMFMVTKPNFLALAPVLLIVLLACRSRLAWTWKRFAAACVAGLVPFIVYTLTQFGFTMSPAKIFGSYASMPGLETVTGLSMSELLVRNLLLFVQDSTPAYLLVTFGAWTVFLCIRLFRKTKIEMHEYAAYGVALLTIAYFLKMPGFFRYLFVAQILTFPYFVTACQELVQLVFASRATFRRAARLSLGIVFTALIALQAYQTLFRSFVAGYYSNTRTRELTEYFRNADPTKSIFVYHAPEVVTFIPHENYYQYFELLYFQDAFGKEQLPRLTEGVPDLVIVAQDEKVRAESYLEKYQTQGTLDNGNYLLYERK